MDAQGFVGLFRNEEFQKLLAGYRKMAEPLDYIDSLPPIKTPHYNGPPHSHRDTELLRRMVMEKQAALGAYLLKVLELPAVQTMFEDADSQDVQGNP